MFDVELQIDQARAVMREYVQLRAELDELQARAHDQLGKAVLAYEVLDKLPERQRPDRYRATVLGAHLFGEDLVGELAMANRCSEGTARMLADQVSQLMHKLPDCWRRVGDETVCAPIWQARQVLEACAGLDEKQCQQVDAAVAPGLGVLPARRLSKLIRAEVMLADPKGARAEAKGAERFARTWGDQDDPATGWVQAKTDRADAIFLDATIQLVADALEAQGDTRDPDQRRAAALGVLANPAAAVQLIGLCTTRGMPNPPTCQEDADALVEQARRMTPLERRTRLHVHVWAGHLGDPDAVARVEGVGPVLLDQVKTFTAGSKVTVAKTVHVGPGSVGVDAYEIPDRIRAEVIARDRHPLAPWSSIEARDQDLDHIDPYREGVPDQTRPDNLAPVSRGFHRWKTHAGWRLILIRPGKVLWVSGAGQAATVDNTGTHPLRI